MASPNRFRFVDNRRQLQWLLDGLTVELNQAHRPVHAKNAV
jgi:hypothetical protein